jgi:hypothetical protein
MMIIIKMIGASFKIDMCIFGTFMRLNEPTNDKKLEKTNRRRIVFNAFVFSLCGIRVITALARKDY